MVVASKSCENPYQYYKSCKNPYQVGGTKLTTSGAHDVIAITSLQKNDHCTDELQDGTEFAKSLDEVSLPLRKARFGLIFQVEKGDLELTLA